MEIINNIVGGLVGALLVVGHFLGFVAPAQAPVITPPTPVAQEEALGAYNVTGGGTYRLKSSIGGTDTTVNLSSFKEPSSNLQYTMSYLNTTVAYGTVDPQTTRSEFVSFTGITQNSDGSAVLTGVTRGLTRTPAGSSCTASTTLAVRHPGQAVFILSDSPCHFAEYAVKRNDETVSGQWSFPYPSASSTAATKGYVDSLALSGNTTVDRLIVSATAGETVATGNILYFNRFEGEWRKADADFASTSVNVLLGVAQGAGTDGVSISGGVLLQGLDSFQGGMTIGQRIYLSGTAGATSTSAGTFARHLGNARTATTLYFDPAALLDNAYFSTASTTDLIVSGNSTTTNATTTKLAVSSNLTVTSGCSGCANIQVFDASGTWTKPTGGNRVLVQAWGAGGGGTDGDSGSETGSGGGGGSYVERWFLMSELGSTETVTVGAGGLAAQGGGDAAVGGNTTFGSLLTAYGGGGAGFNVGGGTAGGGGGAGTLGVGQTITSDTGGTGGLPSAAAAGADSGFGAGGGGGGSAGAAGGSSTYGGGGGGGSTLAGGSSVFGGGGGGFTGGSSIYGGAGGGNGANGTAPGGGGGLGTNGSTNAGDGAAGRVVVIVY
jgi:hypothetical protein